VLPGPRVVSTQREAHRTITGIAFLIVLWDVRCIPSASSILIDALMPANRSQYSRLRHHPLSARDGTYVRIPHLSAKVKSFMFNHATSSQTPPASVIFFSANLLKYLARMTTGISGILPFPSTFEYPRGRRSRTGAVLEFFLER
jgi:hypothetical protein